MSRFNSESAGNEFKNLCIEVLPAIGNIEKVLEKAGVTESANVRISKNGYLAFEIYGSEWRMARYEKEGPAKIIYEHSEEISVPDGRTFDKVSENLVEISLAFASLQPEIREGREVDSITWKQEFVVWANEFEQMYENADWGTDETDGKDYIDAIEEFAKKKIRKFAGLEG